MTDPRPDPLIAAEVDLRDFEYMPLKGDKLFKSDTWILADDEARVAALRGWWASWHQEPAGSLPNDDRLLADLCGYGVAVSAWRKIRPQAMRGWIECTDGRLYHPTVCSIAIDVWGKKIKKATDNAADRERKRRKRSSDPADKTKVSGGHPAENALKEKEKGSEEGRIDAGASEPDLLGATGTDLTPALDSTDVGRAVCAWNAMAERKGLTLVQKISEPRRAAMLKALGECGGVDGFGTVILERIERSSHLTGKNDRGWACDFDWMLKPANFLKIAEGKYDDRTKPGGNAPGNLAGATAAIIADAERADAARNRGSADDGGIG